MKSQVCQLAISVLVLSAMSASAAVRYVDVNSVSPTPPFTNWTTAATTIQDAVNAAEAADQILVTNGVYQTGGRALYGVMNRVALNKPVTVQSVNGAAATVIRGFQVPDTTNGDGAIRCVYLTNGASLVGFTLTNGATPNSGDQLREQSGGAVWCESPSAVVSNCTLSANSAAIESGGASGGTLNNCTLSGNSAGQGGGAGGATLNNCIVYYNSAPNGDNHSDSSLSYSCTTPLPPEGMGNIRTEPQLADLSHLTAGSLCRGAGSAAYANGLDIDGETWADPPSIGCDEYHPGGITGPLSVTAQAAHTNVAVGFAVNFTAAIDGRATANRWEFGDGMVTTNRPDASHSWALAGDFSTVFRAYNGTYPGGVSATITVHVVAQPTHYVALGSANPVPPYTSWATAGNNIQDVVDAASVAGGLVLVTNGVYEAGERVVSEAGAANRFEVFPSGAKNRVAVTKALMVRSVNGAAVTVIQGDRDPGPDPNADRRVRCVYLAHGAALVGFTLTNGWAIYGGGVWCESASALLSNCVLTGNAAHVGGGANGGTLSNCILTGNSVGSDSWGGGASYCRLNNCTISGNSSGAGYIGGGGAVFCTLSNCIVFNNTLHQTPVNMDDNYRSSDFSYSCTTPLPSGIGNFTNAPLFVDYVGGNLRLQSNSPCINAGANDSAPAAPDLDGNPRIVGGTVDIGAYEFQSPQSLISYAWLQQFHLPTDGSADHLDPDSDGLNNSQEWQTGTDPTNALSALRLLSPASVASGLIVSWQSVSGLNYFLERGTDLGAQPAFLPLATNIVGQTGTTTFTDTNAVGAGPFLYRVGVKE